MSTTSIASRTQRLGFTINAAMNKAIEKAIQRDGKTYDVLMDSIVYTRPIGYLGEGTPVSTSEME